MDKVTVIIPHYHKARRENLKIIDDAVRDSSYKASLVVFNNNPEYLINGHINSSKNYGSSVRYAIAPVIQSDIYIFHDDDLSICHNTIQTIVDFLHKKPDAIVGFCGSNITDPNSPYKTRKHINANKAPGEYNVDIVLGRLTAMRRETLGRAVSYLCRVPLDIAWTHEDIPISIFNRPNNYLIPIEIRNLDTCGVGLEHQQGHYDKRDELAKQCLRLV